MKSSQDNLTKPVIFIGPGRSGSTIISEFIMVHEDLAWPTNYLEFFPKADWTNHLRKVFDNDYWSLTGEKGQINRTKMLNDCLPRPAEAYPFWERLTRKEINFSRGFLLKEIALDYEKEHIRSTFSSLISSQKRKKLAIKITGPGRISYLKSIFPDAIFINIVRDIDRTVNSFLNVPFWKDLGMNKIWWTGAYSNSDIEFYKTIQHDPKESTEFQIRKIINTTKKEAEQCNARMITIQYEDFIKNPSDVVNLILNFADLPRSSQVSHKLNHSAVHNRNTGTQKAA
jgi:hypothetical protein